MKINFNAMLLETFEALDNDVFVFISYQEKLLYKIRL